MSFLNARKIATPLAALVGAATLLTGPSAAAATTTGAQVRPADSRVAASSTASVHTWISGLPAHVRRGSTITFSLWYRVYSSRTFTPMMFAVYLANSGPQSTSQYRGTSMEFYDPATRRWEGPGPGSDGAAPLFAVGGKFGTVRVPAGGVGRVTFRIHVGNSSYLGAWRLAITAEGMTLPGYGPVDGWAWIKHFSVSR